jgi:hypothetical protein
MLRNSALSWAAARFWSYRTCSRRGRPPCTGGAVDGRLPRRPELWRIGSCRDAGPRWLTLPVLALHGLCAAWWIGAFAPLLLALRRLTGEQALLLLRAFSRLVDDFTKLPFRATIVVQE